MLMRAMTLWPSGFFQVSGSWAGYNRSLRPLRQEEGAALTAVARYPANKMVIMAGSVTWPLPAAIRYVGRMAVFTPIVRTRRR